jgi:hypothetical protein
MTALPHLPARRCLEPERLFASGLLLLMALIIHFDFHLRRERPPAPLVNDLVHAHVDYLGSAFGAQC